MIRIASLATISLLLSAAAIPAVQAQPTAPAASPALQGNAPVPAPALFARVNGTPISAADFDRKARETFRQKFYHGQPPEAEVQSMLRSVGQQLVDSALLATEIERRKIAPDMAEVEAEIAKYEKQYANSENWKKTRDQALPGLTDYLAQRSRLAVLEKQIRAIPEPDEAAVRAFYAASKELFTEPEKIRISQILLKIDPSSPSAAWEEAMTEAKKLHESLVGGADFAELAKSRSGDASAANGGDMGYLHRGMLSDDAYKHLDALQPGEMTAPIRSLHGVLLIKLTDRQKGELRPFADVAARAKALLQRERSDAAWEAFLKDLQSKYVVEIDPRFSAIMNPTASQ